MRFKIGPQVNQFLRRVADWKLEAELFLQRKFHTVVSPESARVIISMTSYPARIRHAWISLETLFRQDYPSYAVVLVLTTSQFPHRRLPRKIRHLEKRGLTVLWVVEDGKSADHIWPAYSMYRHARIVSVDDDKFFPKNLLELLVEEANKHPEAIVGARGWELAESKASVAFGENWTRATNATPSSLLFMPPGNGSLYPPGSLPELAGNYELMREVCPTADDVWFWAMGLLSGTESRCLGMGAHRPVIRQVRTHSLASLNAGPAQFKAVLRHFSLESKILSAIRKQNSGRVGKS